MNFNWKIPHDFYPRLAQALVTAGAAGLLYAGACRSASYAPAVQTLAAETEYASESAGAGSDEEGAKPETEGKTGNESSRTSKAETDSGTGSISETESASETNRVSGSDRNSDADRISGASSDSEAGGVSGAETDSGTETDSRTESSPASETTGTPTGQETENPRIKTEIPGSALETETPGETEISNSSEYAFRAPYANPESALSTLQEGLTGLFQFQPNYLSDLTEVSLSWEHLEEELTSLTESYSGDWAVYVKDLSNGETININQHPMESASLIKLYIMGAVMEQIREGTLEETDTVSSLLNEMITVSDNEAANELVRYLSDEHDHKDGLEYLNSFAERHGFADTQQVNGLEDASLRHNPSMINKTSARDCGELLAQIYEGTLVSHLASRKMESLLLGQEITYKIPSALPDEAVSASKTGEVSDAENDSAIIYSPGGDFILCIMSGKWDSGNQAVTHIREITKLVYNHFNPPDAEQSSVSG